MTQRDAEQSVLHDVLRVYDHRFLELPAAQRDRLVQGTKQVIGDGLSDAAKAALPAAFRLRAFCIQRGLRDELDRLIRDEADGRTEGAVVVGGRVYAVYPYLRGVPRQDADITAEVGVEHRLDDVAWSGGRLRIRGLAGLERVEAREVSTELILRRRPAEDGDPLDERRYEAGPHEEGFEALAGVADLTDGRWDAFVAVTTLGVRREARFGTVRGPRLKAESRERGTAMAYFTKGGHLAVRIGGDPGPGLRTKIRRRLAR